MSHDPRLKFFRCFRRFLLRFVTLFRCPDMRRKHDPLLLSRKMDAARSNRRLPETDVSTIWLTRTLRRRAVHPRAARGDRDARSRQHDDVNANAKGRVGARWDRHVTRSCNFAVTPAFETA